MTRRRDSAHTGIHTVIGAGPVGRATARALLERRRDVRIVHLSGTCRLAGIETRQADVYEARALAAALEGSASVYFCARPPARRWLGEAAALFRHVVVACQRIDATLVCASGMQMLRSPAPGHAVDEEAPADAASAHGRLQARLDAQALWYHRNGRLRTVVARAATLYGPGVRASILPEEVFDRLLRAEPMRPLGALDELQSFTFVDDFGRALAELGGKQRSWGQIWHVPNVPPLTLRELLLRAAGLAGRAPVLAPLPRWALRAGSWLDPRLRDTLGRMHPAGRPWIVNDFRWRRHMDLRESPLDDALGELLRHRRALTGARAPLRGRVRAPASAMASGSG